MLSTSDENFRDDLKKARIAAGLSGAELGLQVKISSGMIARYESKNRIDKVLPNPETLRKINAVLFPKSPLNLLANVDQDDEEIAENLPLNILINAIKKRGAKEIVF